MSARSCTDCRWAKWLKHSPYGYCQFVIPRSLKKKIPKAKLDSGVISQEYPKTNCPTWEKEESDGHSDKAE